MLSETQLYFIGNDPYSPPHDIYFYKVTFGNTGVDWANKMSCPSAPCYITTSDAILSSDSSQIYEFFLFGTDPNNYIYMASFNTTNGGVIGSRYKSSIVWNLVYGSALNGDYIAASAKCTSTIFYIILYNLVSYEFVIRKFSGSHFAGLSVETSTDR